MLAALPNFIGLSTEYENADGQKLPRLHMDGAASPLAARTALESITDFLPHYSNTHSHVHNSARISSQALQWARSEVLRFVKADPQEYACVFLGAGTTAAINRIARGLQQTSTGVVRPEVVRPEVVRPEVVRPDVVRPEVAQTEKNIVLVSAMEHHANDLPHRQFGNEVLYMPLINSGPDQGAIDLTALEHLLEQHNQKVRYLTFSAVSNVTGIINPVSKITELAHRFNVMVVVDAAQAVAHQNIQLSKAPREAQADFLIFSGHKVYCPMGPGVLIARKSLLERLDGQDMGGGAVTDVSYYDYELSDLPDREQAGTPNIVGAIALAKVMQELQNLGRENIEQHAIDLLGELKAALDQQPNIRVYGLNTAQRIGALAFNHANIDHGLLAAILNDYYLIAVRNACFCAHPYVSSLLKEELWQIDLSDIDQDQHEAFINRKRGMVRASLSLYNSREDIQRLISALQEIDERIEDLRPLYQALPDGNYRHKNYELNWQQQLDWE